ncbi:hypothetical protein [Floridanema aerugineum]|uniref:Uncharacterized protein n=1 Tax=Floridaenema aerugineum BLCC-F46 TaxID=3153654 RepID=A0ABV4X3X3_9CYAN
MASLLQVFSEIGEANFRLLMVAIFVFLIDCGTKLRERSQLIH